MFLGIKLILNKVNLRCEDGSFSIFLLVFEEIFFDCGILC